MKTKTTNIKLKSLIIFSIITLFCTSINAQVSYCMPSFANGCTTWENQTITLDSINWSLGSGDCTIGDYTTMSTTLTQGVATAMTVVNGTWCGVGVWIDFNSDGVFDSTENMYHAYNAAMTQTYTFNVTVPMSVVNGTYRMRVVSGWGTDCYNTVSNANGYGACGAYQYGNYDDFTIHVGSMPLEINTIENNKLFNLEVSPNPAEDYVNININGVRGNNATITLADITGKIIRTESVTNDKLTLDLSTISQGMYFLTYTDSNQHKVAKLKK